MGGRLKRALKALGVVVGALVAILALLIVLGVTGVIGPPSVAPEQVARSVQQQDDLLERAFALPVAERYGESLHWQSNGSLCGPASVVNVRRSLGETVESEAEVLDGTGLCVTGMCFMGLTLDELADVVRAQGGLSVTVLRDLDLATFREHLRRSNDPSRRYIVNFSRRPIFEGGGGHHSPIGGYLEEEDLVLVLDVNRAYRPWLVESERLFAAVDTLDGEQKRGLLLIEPTD